MKTVASTMTHAGDSEVGPADRRVLRHTRTQPGRGEAKRRHILDAAVQVIGAGGLASLTLRGVADAAGVPLGSMTYYFHGRDELIDQTMAYAVACERRRMLALLKPAPVTPSLDEAVRLLTVLFLDKTIADPLYDLALFEMFMEATRSPGLRKRTIAWSALIADIIDRVLPPTDPAVPRGVAIQIVAALIDGLMLESASNRRLTLSDLSDHLRVAIARLTTPQ
jgi:AcrR family transcriptional regulator